MNNLKLCFLFLFFLFGSCKDETPEPSPEVPANAVTPEFRNLSFSTDKVAYKPGEEVAFTIDFQSLPTGVSVRYKYLNQIAGETPVTSATWKWQTPAVDFRGYMAEVFKQVNNVETIYATIGIDVSSDWIKFPRYGFLSDFGQMTDDNINEVISNLGRYHINGIQFYDWQNKHHKPLPVDGVVPASSWKDIANRDIYFSTVEKYINSAHRLNMKTMFYDLVYGAWSNAEADGVKKEWYIYKDQNHNNMDFFSLGPPFISNLYFMDPENTDWQNYMASEVKNVYEHLGFDGYHMDQVGDRGIRFRFDGSQMNLSGSFGSFINAIKKADPGRYNVMNAVAQYGQSSIAGATTDFLYTEVWSPAESFGDLAGIIKENNALGANTKNSVLAAYINYDKADSKGFFNTASVLLADAVIFAFGGDHLELGEHMLCKEYFPNNNLAMKDDLKKALINYYDFLTAYQNILRDGGSFNSVSITPVDFRMSVSAWPAGMGKVAVFGKKCDNKQVIHLINFTASTTQSWRDKDAIQVTPALIRDAKLVLTTSETIKNIWMATPDFIGGASRKLNFIQSGDKVSFTLPELRYWDMIVAEY